MKQPPKKIRGYQSYNTCKCCHNKAIHFKEEGYCYEKSVDDAKRKCPCKKFERLNFMNQKQFEKKTGVKL
jgi:hypothetical protein